MTGHPLLQVESLQKKFGDFVALDQVSFEVEKGEMLAIIGPNGSGKSTLARILIGLDEATQGKIRIEGKTPKQAVKRIGFVPQYFALDRSLPITVEEFLALVPCDVPPHQESVRIHDILQEVGMHEQRKKILGQLSGGQLQRVLIARALLHERDILILDEPSSSIDVQGQEALFLMLKKINQERKATIIVISHELDFVLRFSSKVLCLDRKMICFAPPREALSSDVLQRLYGQHVIHEAAKFAN
ncbi:MAG: metal ABC transporter ATP-binding protein [Candidatus Nomurabacteria bacterium]|nr:MAG: metal ABC transporter ATP-binding protein [Candidatus Nomurabacteria bacterium]